MRRSPAERLHSASMRAVVQRVSGAAVKVDGDIVGRIGAGLVVLVGAAPTDSMNDVGALSAKLAGLRIFRDDYGKMNRSVGRGTINFQGMHHPVQGQ